MQTLHVECVEGGSLCESKTDRKFVVSFSYNLVPKRPNMRKCNTQLRCPSPILMKFGPEVGFGPKPTPDEKFLDFDPKNGVILGSEG